MNPVQICLALTADISLSNSVVLSSDNYILIRVVACLSPETQKRVTNESTACHDKNVFGLGSLPGGLVVHMSSAHHSGEVLLHKSPLSHPWLGRKRNVFLMVVFVIHF